MKTTLFDSLSKVLEKFNSSNFIQMTWFGLGNITGDDLKAFSDYFGLEPERLVYGDWDVLMFKKDGKKLDINDYAKMRRHVYDLIDDLQQQLVKQTPKKEDNKEEDFSLEDKFISTLDLEQMEMFAVIITKTKIAYDAREEELLQRIIELEDQLKGKKK